MEFIVPDYGAQCDSWSLVAEVNEGKASLFHVANSRKSEHQSSRINAYLDNTRMHFALYVILIKYSTTNL